MKYYRTIFDNEHQYASQGLVNTTAQKYFLKSSSAQYGNVLSEIFVQTFIDRTTGEFYSDVELLNNEVGAISSFVSRGTCELQDAPITKF